MMTRQKIWLCVLLLMMVASPAPSEAQVLPKAQSVAAELATGSLPDSVRFKTFTALAQGDVEAAVGAYMAHKNLQDAPKWLQAFQSAFSVANREMSRCPEVARAIHEAFRRFGATPEYVRIFATGNEGARYLSWQSRIIMSDNNLHFAVRYNGRIYDAFAGVSGMAEAEYRAAVHAQGILNIILTEAP
jgi:hypothetical protein